MKPAFDVTEIPEIAGMVAYVMASQGKSREEIEVALHLAGEMIAAGRGNPVEILREVQGRMEHDLPWLMEEAQARRNATRSAALVYRETGTKTAGGSPHAVHRSNRRKPGERWDLQEGGQ